MSTQYRRLYIAGFITALGSQATYVAVPYQLRLLTHSTLDVGSIGLAELLPLVVFGLYGGVLADRLNRRRLIISMEQVLMISTAVLFVNALLPHPQAWILYVDAFVASGAGSLQRPSIEALNQMFVPHEMQRAASALANIRMTTASIIGPALGGLAAVAFGPASVYLANLVTFSLSLILLYTLHATAATVPAEDGDVAALRSGLRYAMSRPDIVGTYIIDLLAMILAFPVVMLPFVAARFHETYALSLLYCGLPAGALIATLTSGWSRKIHRYGRAIVFAAALWGVGIALFGYSSSLWLVLLGLAVGGPHPRTLDRDTAPAERHRTSLVAVAHRGPLRVPLPLRADDILDLLLHQLAQHAEPDTNAQREQSLLRSPNQLPQRLLDTHRQNSFLRGRLRDRYVLIHGGSSFDLGRIAAHAPNQSGRGRRDRRQIKDLRTPGQPRGR